jgi:shikimate dehydrogenase
MKKYLIIGKPIEHSLSPKIHNYWFKNNNVNAVYEKLSPEEDQLERIIEQIRDNDICGINVTVPYKQSIIPFLEDRSDLVRQTNSVNTIFKKNGKIYGDNTDVFGFEKSITNKKIEIKNKSIFILGAGGVVPSIISALENLKVGKIILSNRTLKKAEKIQKNFHKIKILEWGKIENFDIFINATSIGLKKSDTLKFDFTKLSGNKVFYDVIYNPSKTNFLKEASKLGHITINGRDMFLYQAQKAFKIWHNILPKIDEKLLKYLYND